MRILRHYRDAPIEVKGAVIALGNFDGVHRGHQALIARARETALARQKPLAVLAFEPSPREFFRPDDEPFRLTPFRTKAKVLAQLGVDILIVLSFDAEMAGKLAQDFVLDVLVNALAADHVVVGEDFRFGKGRGGDATALAYMGEMEGFGVTVFPPLSFADASFSDASVQGKISSSDIRAALKGGRPHDAARLLGHWWSTEGHVGHGDARGREIGFPTANLKLEHTIEPRFGIYAVRAHVQGQAKAYDGVANFGIRPMFELKTPLLEVHLFDFSGNLYGELLTVEWIAYLREEKKFDTLDVLKEQIAADGEAARRILSATGTGP